ncbi:MAG: hypothetical protein AAF317_07990, partial [Pseudomonadota bacterium]
SGSGREKRLPCGRRGVVQGAPPDEGQASNDPLLEMFLPPDASDTTSTVFDAFLSKAGVVYDFTQDVSLGFTFSAGTGQVAPD